MRQHDPYTPILEALRYQNSCETEEQFLERLKLSKPVMKNLRKSYDCGACRVDYSSCDTRAAYMLGYYPHYIEIAHTELSKIENNIFPSNWETEEVNACFLGGGPGPEILGWITFLQEHFPNVNTANAYVFDKHSEDWKFCLEVTQKIIAPNYWKKKLNIIPIPFDLLKDDKCLSKEAIFAIENSNFIVMQNCLNDQPGTSTSFTNLENIFENLIHIIENIPPDSLVLMADLKFPRARDLMRKVENEITNNAIGRPIVPVCNKPYCIYSSLVFPTLLNHLFTGEDGLIGKRKTEYFSSLIYKDYIF